MLTAYIALVLCIAPNVKVDSGESFQAAAKARGFSVEWLHEDDVHGQCAGVLRPGTWDHIEADNLFFDSRRSRAQLSLERADALVSTFTDMLSEGK